MTTMVLLQEFITYLDLWILIYITTVSTLGGSTSPHAFCDLCFVILAVEHMPCNSLTQMKKSTVVVL